MQGLYEQLVVDGYEGSYDTVRRYILRLKDKNVASKGYIPLAFDAGDALQFDWSQEFITLNGEDKKVYRANPEPRRGDDAFALKKCTFSFMPFSQVLCGCLFS